MVPEVPRWRSAQAPRARTVCVCAWKRRRRTAESTESLTAGTVTTTKGAGVKYRWQESAKAKLRRINTRHVSSMINDHQPHQHQNHNRSPMERGRTRHVQDTHQKVATLRNLHSTETTPNCWCTGDTTSSGPGTEEEPSDRGRGRIMQYCEIRISVECFVNFCLGEIIFGGVEASSVECWVLKRWALSVKAMSVEALKRWALRLERSSVQALRLERWSVEAFKRWALKRWRVKALKRWALSVEALSVERWSV